MMLRLGSSEVARLILRTWSFMFLEILCSSSRVNFVLRRCFNFRFIHERMFWEELDDRPEVIQSSFSYVYEDSPSWLLSRC